MRAWVVPLFLFGLATVSGCWRQVAHETAPQSVSDPQVEFRQLVMVQPPLGLIDMRVEPTMATFVSAFGSRALVFHQIRELHLRRRGRSWAVDAVGTSGARIITFRQPNEEAARRLCDVLAALHALSPGGAPVGASRREGQ